MAHYVVAFFAYENGIIESADIDYIRTADRLDEASISNKNDIVEKNVKY